MSGSLRRLADLVESLEAAQLTCEDACKMHAREMRIIQSAYGRFLKRNRERNRALLNKGIMAGCLDWSLGIYPDFIPDSGWPDILSDLSVLAVLSENIETM